MNHLHLTSCIKFTGVLFCWFAVALYVYPVYYNNVRFAHYSTLCFTCGSPHCNNVVQLICCLFSPLVNLTLIHAILLKISLC